MRNDGELEADAKKHEDLMTKSPFFYVGDREKKATVVQLDDTWHKATYLTGDAPVQRRLKVGDGTVAITAIEDGVEVQILSDATHDFVIEPLMGNKVAIRLRRHKAREDAKPYA